MKTPILIFFYFAFIAINLSCSDLLEPFKEMTSVDPCDPGQSVYQADSHYFERDFLRVDGSLDYNKLVNINKPQASPCDPLYNPDLLQKSRREE